MKKYAKYKAAYIHKCLKSGETPIPGPVNEEGEDMGQSVLYISSASITSGSNNI